MTPKRPFLSPSVRPGGFVDILLLLALGGTWLGLLGRFHWALDLFSHFRWQYLLICVVGVAWSLALKRPRWIQALCLASLLVNAAALFLAKGDPAYATTDGPHLRVVSLNVQAGNPDKAQVLEYLRATDADLFFLMEVDAEWAAALAELAATHPHHLEWPQEDNFGLAFFSRVPLQSLEVIHTSQRGPPSIRARLTHAGRELAILGIHPPPPIGRRLSQIRDTQLADTAALVASLDVPVLVVGDLNATPWSHGLRLLRDGTTLDHRSPDPSWTPTWNVAFVFPIPIDHALVTPPLVVARRKIGPEVGSDHRPQILDIGWQK
jgi:endonuclease/exonuclease/phosphatase (EEP) superfamily protein YafD